MKKNNNNAVLSIKPFVGTSKKTGKEFKAFELTIGEWSTLVFPRSSFEYSYIEKLVGTGYEMDLDDEDE